MVVTNVLLTLLIVGIIADIWHRETTHRLFREAWLAALTQRFQEQEDRIVRAIRVAIEFTKASSAVGVTESPAPSSVEQPPAPERVPNIGRKLDPIRFAEETVLTGARELIDGAAARGITLSLDVARRQAMLMLNGEDID